MKTSFPDVDNDILHAVKYMPSVSVIIPFEPKMSSRTELEYKLKIVIDRVKEQLETSYPVEKAASVLDKLKETIKKLDFSTYKKSIAIFISSYRKSILS